MAIFYTSPTSLEFNLSHNHIMIASFSHPYKVSNIQLLMFFKAVVSDQYSVSASMQVQLLELVSGRKKRHLDISKSNTVIFNNTTLLLCHFKYILLILLLFFYSSRILNEWLSFLLLIQCCTIWVVVPSTHGRHFPCRLSPRNPFLREIFYFNLNQYFFPNLNQGIPLW